MGIKPVLDFIAIMGILSTVCGIASTTISVITVFCIILYFFYPGKPSQRDIAKAQIQNEIWELERKQNESYTSWSPKVQDKIEELEEEFDKL